MLFIFNITGNSACGRESHFYLHNFMFKKKDIHISFKVDDKKILFFKDHLKINTDIHELVFESKNNLKVIKNGWFKIEDDIKYIINKFFLPSNNFLKVTIYIFPENFYLGASETLKGIVLFGQPARTSFFPQAIILHELVHVLLSRVFIQRPVLVDEVICSLFESYVYSTFGSKSFSTIWKRSDLDVFHQASYDFIINNPDIEINQLSIESHNVYQLISLITQRLDLIATKIKPKIGLLNQLK